MAFGAFVSSFGACASGTRFEDGASSGDGGGSAAASTSGSGTSASASGSGTSASASGTSGASSSSGGGLCSSAGECAGLTDACNIGTCINGACVGVPTNEMASCDDGVKCTDAVCQKGACVGAPKSCPGSDACHIGSCDTLTEACLETAIVNCQGGDGCCPPGCDSAFDDDCAPPTSFKVLNKLDVNYQGIDYVLLQVSMISDTSVAANWCYEYQNLCAMYGAKPTGCGQMFNSDGYGICKSQYGSDGISDSLGCNASGGVAAAANQAGFADANTENSFAFHYCDVGTCTKQMCSGMYCNTALSYIDMTKPLGYTLCKK